MSSAKFLPQVYMSWLIKAAIKPQEYLTISTMWVAMLPIIRFGLKWCMIQLAELAAHSPNLS